MLRRWRVGAMYCLVEGLVNACGSHACSADWKKKNPETKKERKIK
jgi:hypothetical protein